MGRATICYLPIGSTFTGVKKAKESKQTLIKIISSNVEQLPLFSQPGMEQTMAVVGCAVTILSNLETFLFCELWRSTKCTMFQVVANPEN